MPILARSETGITSTGNRSLLLGLVCLLALVLLALPLEATRDLLVVIALLVLIDRLAWRRLTAWVGLSVGLMITLVLLTDVADRAFEYFFARPLELKYDLFLLPALWDLIEDSSGTLAALVCTTTLLALILLFAFVFSKFVSRAASSLRLREMAVLAPVFLASYLVLIPGNFRSVALAQGIADAYDVANGDDQFERVLVAARQELLTLPDDLGRLRGQDFLFFFIESYGRLLWDDPGLRDDFLGRMRRYDEELKAAGYFTSSRFLESTTFAGASWIAHMSVMSGVECRNTVHWKRLLNSRVRPLPDYFRAQAYRTVSVMPAMDLNEWPEGDYFGFTQNIWAEQLAYVGPRYGWSPMPDQFVLLRFEQLSLVEDDTPVFAEISLTSSHAPFSQIPAFHTGPWQIDELENTLATRKPSRARSIWQNQSATNYATAVDYSLASVMQFLARRYKRDGVLLILGDHQASKAVHRVDSEALGHRFHVPLHIVTRDRSLHEDLLEAGFSDGLEPDEKMEPIPMSALKAFFLNLFHNPGVTL
ncbi:MAG: sulfatase-like hydrolase/transferase [Pseudomonadota bacterium]